MRFACDLYTSMLLAPSELYSSDATSNSPSWTRAMNVSSGMAPGTVRGGGGGRVCRECDGGFGDGRAVPGWLCRPASH